MSDLIIAGARLLTLSGASGARRGGQLGDLGVVDDGWVRVTDDRIAAMGEGEPPEPDEDDEVDLVDAAGCVLMPAFVDCHTHACWAGSRLDEFEQTLAGRPYLEILAEGGGIMSTVRAVREAAEEELTIGILRRLAAMAALGTGTVEIKSGYGLDTATELKMLRAIHAASQMAPLNVLGTFLGAHAIDPAQPGFVDRTISETLPAVVQEFPGMTCDAYCEEGAWSVDDTVRLFEAAREHDCPIRLHADQFHDLGMTARAVDLGALSVDHLEASTPATLENLAKSATFGVALPASGFHLDQRYADARRFVDAGGAIAIATNYNPGSAPTPSIPFAITLACRQLRLTPAEAIAATTWNPACLMGLQDRVGSLEVGKRADLQLLDTDDERDLAYEFAGAGPLLVILGGRVVHTRAIETVGDEEE